MALFLSPTFATSFNKKTMRKSMITLNRKWIRLIGIVGCTMCLASCKQASDASGMKPSYATMKVEATDKELSTSYSATIRGRQDIDIYPQVSGTIEKLCVTEGQKVRRGQLLFIIDQVPYKAALKTAVANVEAARAALATAELTYNSNKELYAQKQKLEEKIKTTENGAEVYKNESAILELQYNAVDEKRQEYQDYMDKLMEQWRMISDKIASKQQSDTMADQAKEMNKIMLVARRIMHGDKVPAKDEKKLMEFDPKLYMMAKNAAAMLEIQKRKEHKSLWEDEEEKEQVSATEEANNTEAFADGPEVVDVETTISNATGELEASGE